MQMVYVPFQVPRPQVLIYILVLHATELVCSKCLPGCLDAFMVECGRNTVRHRRDGAIDEGQERMVGDCVRIHEQFCEILGRDIGMVKLQK